MIVVNLWFVRHSNGLFHYGLDYAEALGCDVREIWVRTAALAGLVRDRLPGATIKVPAARQLPACLFGVRIKRDLLFTPSSHPLTLSRKLVVVVHDSYPFEGRVGRIKRALFRFGLALSGGTAGFVNRADAARFLENCAIPEHARRYLPNRLQAGVPAPSKLSHQFGRPLTVGLFGTDSPKKNYDALFAAFADRSPDVPVCFRIYGHDNAYIKRVRAAYPRCSIEVVRSDECTMEEFINSLNLVVSVAAGEGFGRPLALALMLGVPTWLLDTPVFREFYSGSARLFPTVENLVAKLCELRPGDKLERPALRTEAVLREAFADGVAWLRRQ